MLKKNNIIWKQRLKELFVDYICICIYLLILFGMAMSVYYGIWGTIPEFNELQAQLIAIFASVLPIVLIFSVWDYKKGSMGKRKTGLKIFYKHKDFRSSLLRNIIKFLPWQLAHAGVIHGMYSDFDLLAIVFLSTSMILGIAMLLMGLLRKDKCHFGDLIAKTQVQKV